MSFILLRTIRDNHYNLSVGLGSLTEPYLITNALVLWRWVLGEHWLNDISYGAGENTPC